MLNSAAKKLSRMLLISTGLTSTEDRFVWTRPPHEVEGEEEGTGVASEGISRAEGVALAVEVGVVEALGSHLVTMRRESRTRLSL